MGKSSNGEMPLSGHLRELRNRICVCAVVFLVFTVIGIHHAQALVQVLLNMGEQYNYHFVYISPQELLLEYFSVAFIFAFLITLPVLLYEIYAFASPGMSRREKLHFILALIFGTMCAGIGILFAYKIMLPFMLFFLISIGAGSSVQASISVQNYVSFLMTIFIIFSIIFELPVVSVLLTSLGILKSKWLRNGRKYCIVLIFFIAAIITPPDITSQVMVAVPMIALFEISIVFSGVVEKLKAKKEKQDEETM